ncbi:hypothetical protein LTR56_010133 [Elasticomyces elasticus]|nr:hypothetical protein LTR56_010133 [Elasticomyces elasticus]KAK3658875.1 hypothetical protein LTR22_008700 [Elasticomyces elasticus]KAK4923017.1 hypothetical protein LTR49_009679 [Elasticomyces elasticus]KAK5758089.1 hypothetical protein LTS12_011849 [Elasticomyces elasticus]
MPNLDDPYRPLRKRVAKQDPKPTKQQATPESARYENTPEAPMASEKVKFNQHYVNVLSSLQNFQRVWAAPFDTFLGSPSEVDSRLKKLEKGAAEADERLKAVQTKTDERIRALETQTELNRRALADLRTLLTTTQASRSQPGLMPDNAELGARIDYMQSSINELQSGGSGGLGAGLETICRRVDEELGITKAVNDAKTALEKAERYTTEVDKLFDTHFQRAADSQTRLNEAIKMAEGIFEDFANKIEALGTTIDENTRKQVVAQVEDIKVFVVGALMRDVHATQVTLEQLVHVVAGHGMYESDEGKMALGLLEHKHHKNGGS